jgi:type VI secretion system secreted protein Hcp
MKKTSLEALFATTVLSLAFASPAIAANEFFVSVQGARQGQFKGESTRKGHEGEVVGLSYDYGLKSPRDPASGQATGKRQHTPVTFTKEWGGSTPQFFSALVNNELLRTVKFQFFRTSVRGAEEVFQTVTLTNARVTAIKHRTATAPVPDAAHPNTEMLELEDVSLIFEKIEIVANPSGIAASDTVTGGAN